MKFAGLDQIAYKNGNKGNWTQANQILQTHKRPKQLPSFFVDSFKWN